MHEYAFDVKLAAVVRVNARNRRIAERVVNNLSGDSVALSHILGARARLTEFSTDDCSPRLFEIDGEEIEHE